MSRSLLALLATAVTLTSCAGPARGPCADGTPLGTICGFEEPEDSEWVSAAGVLLVTNMRNPAVKGDHGGFLAALVPGSRDVRRVWPTGKPTDAAPDPQVGDPGCPGPLAGPTFSPHGLTSVGNLVYVVAHANAGAREAVEIFAVDGQGADVTVTWKGCIPQEPNVVANDIAVASDGEVIISNYESKMSLWNTLRAGAFGSQTGDVMGWRRGRGWEHIHGTAASMANGVAVSPDGQYLYWAETGTGQVHRMRRGGGDIVTVMVGGNPDNLSWTPRGTLLVATHTGGAKFLFCALGSLPCRSPWALFELNTTAMQGSQTFAHDGSVVGAVASATEVNGKLYLGSVFDDRIGVLTP